MKKTMIAVMIACGIAAGCKTLPSAQRLNSVSRLVGSAAGIVANASSMDAGTRSAVVETVQHVATLIPSSNDTFAAVWVPAAKERVAYLVDGGRLSREKGELVIYAVELATDGLDYLVDIRYPKVREYGELMSVAVAGFSEGFLAAFRDGDGLEAMEKGGSAPEYDAAALDYIRNKRR